MRPAPGPISARASSRPSASRLESGSSSSSSSRLVQDAAADRQPLAHPGRELGDPLVGAALHRRPPPSSSSIRAPRASRADPVQAGVEGEVLAAAEVAVEERLVAEVADPAAQLPGLARQLAAEHPRLAAARAQQGGEDAQQRRLAGAVGAEDDQRLAGARARPRPRRARCVRRSRGAARRADRRAHARILAECRICGPWLAICSTRFSAGRGRLGADAMIRPADAADLAAIEAIVERAYGVYVERIGMRPGPMDADYAEKVRRGLVSVAEEERRGRRPARPGRDARPPAGRERRRRPRAPGRGDRPAPARLRRGDGASGGPRGRRASTPTRR